MTAEHFALVPPESPALNGGDWLDLGTTTCPPVRRKPDGMPYAPKGYVACRVFRDNVQVTHLVRLDENGSNGGRPTVCGLTRFDRRGMDDRPIKGTADLPGWSMGDSGLFGPDIAQVTCTAGCWSVPVAPTCQTCGGRKGSYRPHHMQSATGEHIGQVWESCPDCTDGVVSEGWLALGAAAEPCRICAGKGHYRFGPAMDACATCNGKGHRVPASLSELVRVQALPVFKWGDLLPHPIPPHVAVKGKEVVLFDNGEGVGSWITDQFCSPPNPGGWVWRIVERVTLSDPITGWRVRRLPECIRHTRYGLDDPCTCGVTGRHESRPLPQQVGLYEAPDALVAEIERRKP